MPVLYRRLGVIVMRSMLIVAALALCLLALPGLLRPHGATPVVAQDELNLAAGERVVTGGQANIFDAITVSDVLVGGQHVGSRRPFEGGDDWVEHTAIFLRNRTNKTIVYVNLHLGFPEAGNGVTEGYAMYMLELGRVPDLDALKLYGHLFPDDAEKRALSFRPGQTLEIDVGDYIDGIRDVVEKKMPLAEITKCAITRARAYFEDGMTWDPAGFGLPDPERLHRVKYFERGYFPGDKTQNWPPWH